MRNITLVVIFNIFLLQCTSQKVVTSNKTSTSNIKNEVEPTKKPSILKIGQNDFYKINISDPLKNDNTVSYGSIVSAGLNKYKINKEKFPALAQNFRIKYIILHYTALDDEKSVKVLSEQAVSAHYLINDRDDNEIMQLVDENKRAYHAGISYWRKVENLNDTSIGIEIVNLGYKTDSIGNRVFVDYPEWQIKKIANLVKDIANRYQIAPINILGHSDVAPTRKQDPGPKFPWKRLYTDYNLGMWYDDATMIGFIKQFTPDSFNIQKTSASFITEVQKKLNSFGYNVSENGIWDTNMTKTIQAFQYHFRPLRTDGDLDMETWAILKTLVQKYPNK